MEQVDMRRNDDGEETTNVLNAHQSFMQNLMREHIEKLSAFWINFRKFKSKVEINQLMPERGVVDEIRHLKKQNQHYLMWKQEREATKAELEG